MYMPSLPTEHAEPPAALADLQRRFLDLIVQPLVDDYRLAPLPPDGPRSRAALDALVKPNDRLRADERVELYARQYWFRLLESITEDFPGVAAILGPSVFHRHMRAYLAAHPPRGYTLRRLGEHVPDYLAAQQDLHAAPGPAAVDMARLEWAHMEVFDAAALPPLTSEHALDQGLLDLHIGLQPHLRLLKLDHPVDQWRLRQQRQDLHDASSNAVSGNGPTPGADTAAPGPTAYRRHAVRLVVHRHDNRVYFKRVPLEAFALLQAIQKAGPFGEALEEAARHARRAPAWWQRHLRGWFTEWTTLLWLTAPPIR
jgi:hypothetical protein